MPTQITYPFDPVGNQPGNFIVGEQHTLTATNSLSYHAIVPRAAPFFTTNLEVKLMIPGGGSRILVDGLDYLLAYRFIEASRSTAKAVYGGISFTDPALNGVIVLKYRTVGGDWTLNDAQLIEVAGNLAMNPRTTTWEQITQTPIHFPPTSHTFDITDMVGEAEVLEKLGDIEDAILIAAQNAIDNPPQISTKQSIGLGDVENYPVSTKLDITNSLANRYMNPASFRLWFAEWLTGYTAAVNSSINSAVASAVNPLSIAIGDLANEFAGYVTNTDSRLLNLENLVASMGSAIGVLQNEVSALQNTIHSKLIDLTDVASDKFYQLIVFTKPKIVLPGKETGTFKVYRTANMSGGAFPETTDLNLNTSSMVLDAFYDTRSFSTRPIQLNGYSLFQQSNLPEVTGGASRDLCRGPKATIAPNPFGIGVTTDHISKDGFSVWLRGGVTYKLEGLDKRIIDAAVVVGSGTGRYNGMVLESFAPITNFDVDVSLLDSKVFNSTNNLNNRMFYDHDGNYDSNELFTWTSISDINTKNKLVTKVLGGSYSFPLPNVAVTTASLRKGGATDVVIVDDTGSTMEPQLKATLVSSTTSTFSGCDVTMYIVDTETLGSDPTNPAWYFRKLTIGSVMSPTHTRGVPYSAVSIGHLPLLTRAPGYETKEVRVFVFANLVPTSPSQVDDDFPASMVDFELFYKNNFLASSIMREFYGYSFDITIMRS